MTRKSDPLQNALPHIVRFEQLHSEINAIAVLTAASFTLSCGGGNKLDGPAIDLLPEGATESAVNLYGTEWQWAVAPLLLRLPKMLDELWGAFQRVKEQVGDDTNIGDRQRNAV